MNVRAVMTANPMTIDPETPVAAAVATMRDRGLRHLPVVDDDGRLLGVVTDRDLRSVILGPAIADYLPGAQPGRLRALARELETVTVGHAMTWGAVTIGPDVAVAQAAAVMVAAGVGSLPVVEQARLVGILTERDVLRTLAATLPSLRGGDPDDYFW
jgi:acetoin utilization protein AcuB